MSVRTREFSITLSTVKAYFKEHGVNLAEGIPQDRRNDIAFYEEVLTLQYAGAPERVRDILELNTLAAIRNQFTRDFTGETEKVHQENFFKMMALAGKGAEGADQNADKSPTDT